MQLRKKHIWALVMCAFLAFPLNGEAEEGASATAEMPAQENSANSGEKAPLSFKRVDVSADQFQEIELDQFIVQEQRSIGKGKKLIKMAAPVGFSARLKRLPEERKMDYIYTALEVAGVTPMPEIKHRMFVESSGGRILPVYVEHGAVEKLNTGLKEEEKAHFLGYHVYSYAKGPAILVVDFSAIP